MTQCQQCQGRAQLYLCGQCTTELRDMLRGLPRWMRHLSEAAVGQVKLGEVGARGRSEPEGLVEYTDLENGDDRLTRDLAAGKFTLNRALAAGGVNARASDLVGEIRHMLADWISRIATEAATHGTP